MSLEVFVTTSQLSSKNDFTLIKVMIIVHYNCISIFIMLDKRFCALLVGAASIKRNSTSRKREYRSKKSKCRPMKVLFAGKGDICTSRLHDFSANSSATRPSRS